MLLSDIVNGVGQFSRRLRSTQRLNLVAIPLVNGVGQSSYGSLYTNRASLTSEQARAIKVPFPFFLLPDFNNFYNFACQIKRFNHISLPIYDLIGKW